VNKPLVLQLEDRKKELAEAAMLLPPNSLSKFERMAGEYAGINYVIELINSIEDTDA
jgi:hypothetical protein